MQLAVQTNLAEYLGPITLHAAVVVVEPDAGQPAYQPVEHAAGPTLCQGSWRTCFQPLTTSRSLPRVARKRAHLLGSSWRSASRVRMTSPRAGTKAGGQGRRLAKIAAKPDTLNPGCALGQAAGSRTTTVGAAVVHEQDFHFEPLRLSYLGDLSV